ncbi:MAG: CoA-disulfide reductase [Candidatus Raymondbacteria bacterium RifOxyC12_full_50_8]|uniref:CoA-disulfide reductase n=1 Tax=Candidatus Raymondbacteria bacterium RIFOXYD12_FULL_49_13 TaxID=1817890 RepID=A0A1F7F5F0_UNCRA|nr:MAG: CoA-disulfide reductase [Candidatus Raymondbacteria bacterium RifOxyB12_full_50_8]OGJ87185.1 MAG: CoA-disulfide reductase [Candidatus Raymondbacteria bacterium RIFOXYA2_FULL_49_16]OGJ95334.1 MAG: CoA-disulfide reductase [Candidatus Raymondbacteria bacterium RifOxyC12_full_50_8]OGK01812.1 MAG: CoA-disulfide reductase [Candidatus Raymondbacteria bacterium RIFOXYD12_FULL_49_13]OGP41181.1 MAG: CoA-disulfide reductase [Candidatus Raymondbacteria bacterium RIFOXYB2_FULL_49_35]
MSKKIVIIGGVAGGASAASRLRRNDEHADIVILERGPYISFANCGLPYYIGGVIQERDALLVQTPEGFKNRFNIDVRVNTEVVAIDRTKKEIAIKNRLTSETATMGYDTLILSPGAYPVKPLIPGIESSRIFTLKTIPDMDAINAAISKGAKSVVVVGGGFIGVEAAENLRQRGLTVTLVEALDQILPPFDPEMTSPLIRELRLNNVSVVLGSPVASFQESGATLVCTLKDGVKIEVDFAVLCIGVKPETALAQGAGLALGERGGIVVDEHMRTSDPDIYAAGDAIEVRDFITSSPSLVPLAGPANRQGRVAADAVCGTDAAFGSVLGTAIVKVFSLGAGSVGMNEKTLRAKNLPCQKIFLHPLDHAGYYPGATQLSIKLLFNPQSGAVYGAQAIGAQGVARRIDVIAMAMQAGMTVFDLENAELSYAPPYGSAKDPINQAGFIAANHIRGTHPLFSFEDLQRFDPGRQVLIDVRTKREFSVGHIPGAMNVPVDDLRTLLDALPRDKELLIYCQVGLRGYIAVRILSQNGFAARNLSGGYKTWSAYEALRNRVTGS